MPLLSTKLSIPPLRSRLVARSRLIQKLNQGEECGFVLISAPAGYGKSTLLAAWLSDRGHPAAWYSLDEGDNDPLRFLAYFAAAMEKIQPGLGDALANELHASPLPAVDSLLTPLINQLAQAKMAFWLVLDDYHVIENEHVHQVIRFLLEHRPAALHLAIATRADPPLQLSRLRTHSAMLELRLADLRFSRQEAADFFTHTMGISISPEDTARITARTEGWIAGLQIAALSMQTAEDVPGLITAFTGSHHHIFDFLLEEILARQTPEIRRFLLYTSLLDQLTAPLCEALFVEEAPPGMRSPAILLDELEHANLFILPLDTEQRWYRYHPLFADILQAYLQQNSPEQIPILHARASAWFEGQGRIAEAIRHALAAGEWERVLRLISANVFALLEQSELPAVARQLERVNSETSRARAWLGVGRAWLAAYTGQLSSVEQYLNETEIESSDCEQAVEQQTLAGHRAAIRAFAAWMGGRREIAVRAAREALECLPPTEYLIRCHSATLLGLSLNDLDASVQAYEQALAYTHAISGSYVSIFAQGCWGYMLILQGKLHEAYGACQASIRLAQPGSTPQPLSLCYIYTNLSMLLYEWNDLEGALRCAREAVALARRWDQADALHFAYTHLGNALFASGDTAGAYAILHQAWQIAHRTSPWFEEITIAQEVDWLLAQGSLEAALQRLRLAQVDIENLSQIYLSPSLANACAQVFYAQGQYSTALMLTSFFIEDLEKKKNVYFLVSALVRQALAYAGLGQAAQALRSLKRALELAAPQGFLRSFFIKDKAFISLLHQARAAGNMPGYVDKLLGAVGLPASPLPARPGAAVGLIEPLTERELEVLKLLAQGSSDKKIASTLVIARETVHKHLKNIYGKLDVHSRTEAIVRANQLGLL